jgi:hypothetical protein
MPNEQPRQPTHRAVGPIRITRLGDDSGDDLSATTTVEERIAMVAVLSARMWELTGWRLPSYTRATMPVRVLRSS